MALYTKLDKKTIHNLALQFRLPPPLSIKGVKEGTVNTYYKLGYPHKNFYLKVDEVGDKKRMLAEIKILKILGKLKKTGIQTPIPLAFVPDFMSLPLEGGGIKGEGENPQKPYFVPLKQKFILIFEEIKGRSLFGKSLKPPHLYDIGKALATLHKVTHKEAQSLQKHRFHRDGLLKVYKEIKTKLIKKHPEADKLIQQNFLYLKKNEPKKIPSGLIHADLFPENILFIKNKLNGILDFEAAGLGPYLFDIAVTLHACCHDGKKFDLAKVRSFLKGYESVRPLAKIEKQCFNYYMTESALRFLLTRLRDFELKDGPVKASPFKDYREFVRRLEEITSFSTSDFFNEDISFSLDQIVQGR